MQNLINGLSIKAKIIANSWILIALMIGLAGYALNTMVQIGNELSAVASVDIPLSRNLARISEYQLEQSIHLERAIRFGEMMRRSSSVMSRLQTEIKKFESFGKKVATEITAGEELSTSALLIVHTEAEIKEISHVLEALKKIEKEHVEFEKTGKQLFALIEAGDQAQTYALIDKVEKEEQQLAQELEKLRTEISEFTERAGHRAEEHEKSAILDLSILTIAALIIGGYIGWVIYRNIIGRLTSTVEYIKHMADGDFTGKIIVQGSDEIGILQGELENMRSGMREMISQINDLTSHLSSAAEEISAVMRETSNNIQQQQSETEQIASAMDQMSVAIRDVSTNVSNTSSAANEANAETGNGTGVVQEAVTGIQQLADQIERTGSVITQVELDSENINTVLDVIKSIAEQTNLLALNAAIEAARAGEQGRGFAVVADEVRTLAGRTQESTAEINEIIENLQAGSRNAVQAMTESREQARTVVEQASLAGTSLNTIADSVSRIDEMSTQIATAAEEQNAVATNMNSNIVRINDMATHNATSAKETYQAGQDLASMASKLQALVERFKVNEKSA